MIWQLPASAAGAGGAAQLGAPPRPFCPPHHPNPPAPPASRRAWWSFMPLVASARCVPGGQPSTPGLAGRAAMRPPCCRPRQPTIIARYYIEAVRIVAPWLGAPAMERPLTGAAPAELVRRAQHLAAPGWCPSTPPQLLTAQYTGQRGQTTQYCVARSGDAAHKGSCTSGTPSQVMPAGSPARAASPGSAPWPHSCSPPGPRGRAAAGFAATFHGNWAVVASRPASDVEDRCRNGIAAARHRQAPQLSMSLQSSRSQDCA